MRSSAAVALLLSAQGVLAVRSQSASKVGCTVLLRDAVR